MTRHEYRTGGARLVAKRGTELPQAKLTPELVRAIRENRRGLTARQWAERLGLHVRTIDKVRTYQTWTHIL